MANDEYEFYEAKGDFQSIYEDIIDTVAYNINKVLTKDVKARLQNIGIDADGVSNDLTIYLYEDEDGKILIDGYYYKLDEEIQKIINVACYEMVEKYSNKTFEFYEALRKTYRKNIKNQAIDIKQAYDYESKQNYIEFCARVGILNSILLYHKSVSIYKDLKDARKTIKQEI